MLVHLNGFHKMSLCIFNHQVVHPHFQRMNSLFPLVWRKRINIYLSYSRNISSIYGPIISEDILIVIGKKIINNYEMMTICFYRADFFTIRFRMHKVLFFCILNNVENYNSYFIQKKDALDHLGPSSIQKNCFLNNSNY